MFLNLCNKPPSKPGSANTEAHETCALTLACTIYESYTMILYFGNSYQFCRPVQRNKREPDNTFAAINMGNIKIRKIK